MEILNKNKRPEDLEILKHICFDVLDKPLEEKEYSNLFCGLYIDGRTRNINYLEDFAAIHSFKIYSKFNYPIFILTPSENILNNDIKYKNLRVTHIKIPEHSSHETYSQFCRQDIWNYIPKQYEKLLYLQTDGFLIKEGWEDFILNNNIDYVGAPWCHLPAIDINLDNQWFLFNYPRIQVGNGGFSYRTRKCCESVSNQFSKYILRERGREDNRFPPEDLFYSYFINGIQIGKVATVKEAIKFCLDPITLEEYNKKLSFGFHYPRKTNEFQQYRDYFLSL